MSIGRHVFCNLFIKILVIILRFGTTRSQAPKPSLDSLTARSLKRATRSREAIW